MIVLRWAAIVVFLICLVLGADGVREWLLAGIALAAFVTVCWTFRGPHTTHPAPQRHTGSNPP